MCWDRFDTTTPEEVLDYRLKQKAYLARYGRESFFAWEHREVEELDECFDAIADILRGENEARQVNENH